MPSSINGIGTHYWGHTELYSDASYITTEWITVGIPIIPIKSLRVRPIGKGYSDIFTSRQQYEVLQKFPSINKKQVRRMYKGSAIFLVAFAISLIPLIEIGFIGNNFVGVIIFFVIFVISYFVFCRWANRFA